MLILVGRQLVNLLGCYTKNMIIQTDTIATWLGTGSINIFGLPFAGKDTQGKILADTFNGILISGGDILRHDHGNEKVQQIMATGGIIPSDLFEEIVVPFLSRPELHGKPLILSEVGRIQGEEQVIMRATQHTGHPTKLVILLTLTEDEVWRRFEASQASHDRGERADDNKNVLQTRLDKFRDKVLPVLEFYRAQNLLVEIDGSLPPEQVTQEIFNCLLVCANK